MRGKAEAVILQLAGLLKPLLIYFSALCLEYFNFMTLDASSSSTLFIRSAKSLWQQQCQIAMSGL